MSTLLARRAFAVPLIVGSLLQACATQNVDVDPDPTDAAVDTSTEDTPSPTDDTPATDDQPAPTEDTPTPIDDQPAPMEDTPSPTDASRCASGLTDCAGSCRDTAADPANCGACNRTCATGQSCRAGVCACPAGQSLCGGACVDTVSDPMNCGACGTACPSGQSCAAGACTLVCPSGQMNCSGACRTVATDAMNCGGCGRACPAGNTCVDGTCTAGTPGGPEFRVQWLGSTNCRSAEHVSVTGANRGGIALANANVFYTGQTATGRFNVASLEGTAVGARYDAYVSNLRTGVVYAFVDATGAPITAPGGMATALREIDGTTGALSTRQLALSSPLSLTGGATASAVGFFSGWDRIVVIAAGRAVNIDLPSGNVLDLGASTLPTRSPCAGWGFWGVAERTAGIVYAVYVASPTTIARRPLPAGPVTTVSSFTSLGNMCSFTLAPGAQRWYWQHARNSQLGGSASGSETLGYCDASSSIAGPACPPSTTSCGGVCRDLATDAENCGACNRACATGQTCAAGACAAVPMRYTRSTPGISVTFVDACLTAGHTTLLTSTDDNTATATMPFAFRYWGVPVAAGATLSVSSNGFLTFGANSLTLLGTSFPSTSTPNGVVAPYARDLVTQGDGVCLATTGVAPDRRFAVHWSNVRGYLVTGSALTFEAVFNERDLSIDFLYGTMTNPSTGVVGLENATGSAGIGGCPTGVTTYSCAMANSARVRFTPSP